MSTLISFYNASEHRLAINTQPELAGQNGAVPHVTVIESGGGGNIPDAAFWKWCKGKTGGPLVRKRQIRLTGDAVEHADKLEMIRLELEDNKSDAEVKEIADAGPLDPTKVPTHAQIAVCDDTEILMAWAGLELSDKKREAIRTKLHEVDPELAELAG